MSEQFTADNKDPIFISYARKDGREIAAKLRDDLLGHGFIIWQDVVAMEAGDKWWEQIKAAIEGSATMVLVLTDGALASDVVHDEWTYARTKGTHIIPVTYDKEIYAKAPQWMKKIDIPNLNHTDPDHQLAWTRLLRQLNDPPERKPRPFTVPNLPEHFVQRPAKFDALIAHLLDENRQNPVAITTALQGGGGFGKTTLAIALCHDEKVRVAFDDGILWLQFRENMTQAQALDLLNTQNRLLAPDTPNETDITVASSKFRDLLSDRNILIVIDDAWTEQYLRYVIHEGTAYLITTRLQTVVTGAKAQSITVDDMETSEASDLLAKWLPETPSVDEIALLNNLAKRLGEWALLLELVGAELRELLTEGYQLDEAIDDVTENFESRGISFLDRENEGNRNKAISISMDASISRLKPDKYAEERGIDYKIRFYELAIFPEDTPIPFDSIMQLWQATTKFDERESKNALRAMNRLSLFTRYDVREKALRLHDVVRQIMLEKLNNPAEKHRQLIGQWGDLTQLPDNYAWERIAYHLKEADSLEMLHDLLFDFDFLRTKLEATSPQALIADCNILPDKSDVQLLKSTIDMSGHILSKDAKQIHTQLYSRLMGHRENYPKIDSLLTIIQSDNEALYALPHAQTLQPAGSSLVRKMLINNYYCEGIFINDKYVISAGTGDVIVWNWKTGQRIRSFQGKSAIAGYKDHIITKEPYHPWDPDNLLIYNWRTGQLINTLRGHRYIRCIAMHGEYAISGSEDNNLFVWNWRTGKHLRILQTKGTVNSVVMNEEFALSLSGDSNNGLTFWNWKTGKKESEFASNSGTLDAPIAIYNYYAITVKNRNLIIWDLKNNQQMQKIEVDTDEDDIYFGHTEHVSMNRDYAVSVHRNPNYVVVWNWKNGERMWSAQIPDTIVQSVSIQEDYVISGAIDGLIVWNWRIGEKQQQGLHYDEVHSIQIIEKLAISASANTFIVWNWKNGSPIKSFDEFGSLITLQNNIAICFSKDRLVALDWEKRQVIRTQSLEGKQKISIDGDFALAYEGKERQLIIWNWRTGERINSIQRPPYELIVKATIQDKVAIFVSHEDVTLNVWNWETNKIINTPLNFTEIKTMCLHNNYIFCDINGGRIKVWKWNHEYIEEIRTIPEYSSQRRPNNIAVTSNILLMDTLKRNLDLWNWITGEHLYTLELDTRFSCWQLVNDFSTIIAGDEMGNVHFLRCSHALQLALNKQSNTSIKKQHNKKGIFEWLQRLLQSGNNE